MSKSSKIAKKKVQSTTKLDKEGKDAATYLIRCLVQKGQASSAAMEELKSGRKEDGSVDESLGREFARVLLDAQDDHDAGKLVTPSAAAKVETSVNTLQTKYKIRVADLMKGLLEMAKTDRELERLDDFIRIRREGQEGASSNEPLLSDSAFIFTAPNVPLSGSSNRGEEEDDVSSAKKKTGKSKIWKRPKGFKKG